MGLLMLCIALVVGSVGQDPLMHTHGFQTALWTSVNDRQKPMFATGVFVGSSGGQFCYSGWQSMADSPTSPTRVDSN
jgi:hypothetical protein